MKKVLLVALLTSCVLFAGCEKVEEEKGEYKEGTYFASAVDNYGGSNNTATAVMYVDSNGVIKSLFLDTTYIKDEMTSTKKALGTDYGMTMNPAAVGEWDEQVEKLEAAVIEKQGLTGITLNEEGKTDAVSGCTIKIDALYKAIEDVLNQAK